MQKKHSSHCLPRYDEVRKMRGSNCRSERVFGTGPMLDQWTTGLTMANSTTWQLCTESTWMNIYNPWWEHWDCVVFFICNCLVRHGERCWRYIDSAERFSRCVLIWNSKRLAWGSHRLSKLWTKLQTWEIYRISIDPRQKDTDPPSDMHSWTRSQHIRQMDCISY